MFGGLRGAVAFAGTIEGRSRLTNGQQLETIGIQLYSVRRELARDVVLSSKRSRQPASRSAGVSMFWGLS